MTPADNHSNRQLDLLPRPAQAAPTGRDYLLSEKSAIECCGEGGLAVAERFADTLAAQLKLRLPVRPGVPEQGYVLRIAGERSGSGRRERAPGRMGAEGYTLDVDEGGARLEAATARGLLWGTMTLRQLIGTEGDAGRIAGVRIADRPRYAWRGFQIDSGRAPNSMAKIKRIIRVCSAFKLNMLVFREGDDEMNAVRYRSNLLGSENPHAFSPEQLGDLADYARAYGIALVPEVESLGHSAAKGLHYPAIVSGGYKMAYAGLRAHTRKAHLAPGDPRSLELLRSIYGELLSQVRPPMIHLGLDEVRLPKEVQAQHFGAILELLFRQMDHGRPALSALVWSDCPPTPGAYQDRVIRCLWEYGDGHAIGYENEHLQNQGIARLSEPACRERVFMAGGSGSGHTPFSKTGCKEAFQNLAEWAQWGARRANFTGLFAVQWSGNMIDDWLPDFLCAADYGWRPPEIIPDFERQYRRIQRHLARLADAAAPAPREIDRPAWDGIWLKDGAWEKEIRITISRGNDATGPK